AAMHRLMGACVSRQLPEDELSQQQQRQPEQKHAAKSPKRAHSFGFAAFKSPWRRQQHRSDRGRRPLSGDADSLAASYASTPAACKSAPPLPDRRPVLLDDRSPSGSRASEDLLPVRSVTIDNFNLAAKSDDSPSLQPEPSATSAAALLRPSLRNRLPDKLSAPMTEAPQLPPHSASANAQLPAVRSGEDRPDTVTTYSEVCPSTDNDSQASGLPVDRSPSQPSVAAPVAAATSVYRRSRLASGASSLDSDDLMLGTDCDTDCEHDTGGGGGAGGDDDTCGGASLTTSRAGTDLADCLIREEEEYEVNQEDADDNQAGVAACADIVGSLMTASLPPDSLTRHLRRQQQPPLSLSLAASSMRFRPRSVSSPQGDLLLLPGSDLRHLAHDVTGVKTLLLRLRRQLLDDGRTSAVVTPTGCCGGASSGGGGGTVCQLCGSDSRRVAELEDRVASLQAEIESLRRIAACQSSANAED
ncbi:hypothetical protein BOX15_Mlig030800g2, partial [Macrostomum lignano]